MKRIIMKGVAIILKRQSLAGAFFSGDGGPRRGAWPGHRRRAAKKNVRAGRERDDKAASPCAAAHLLGGGITASMRGDAGDENSNRHAASVAECRLRRRRGVAIIASAIFQAPGLGPALASSSW